MAEDMFSCRYSSMATLLTLGSTWAVATVPACPMQSVKLAWQELLVPVPVVVPRQAITVADWPLSAEGLDTVPVILKPTSLPQDVALPSKLPIVYLMLLIVNWMSLMEFSDETPEVS